MMECDLFKLLFLTFHFLHNKIIVPFSFLDLVHHIEKILVPFISCNPLLLFKSLQFSILLPELPKDIVTLIFIHLFDYPGIFPEALMFLV